MGNMDDPGADWNELARENAALRKRVEELEQQALFFENESNGWHSKWLEMQSRAEKAERERDDAKQYAEEYKKAHLAALDEVKEHMEKVAANHHALGNWPSCKYCTKFMNDDLEAQAITAKLQADLDAALKWIEGYTDGPSGRGPTSQRVKALLEKRREENRVWRGEL